MRPIWTCPVVLALAGMAAAGARRELDGRSFLEVRPETGVCIGQCGRCDERCGRPRPLWPVRWCTLSFRLCDEFCPFWALCFGWPVVLPWT